MSRSHREMVRPTFRPARTSWPLTPIDGFASRWLIQGTWIFDRRDDAIGLKHGLARLLDAYPILCGRVAAGARVDWAATGIPVAEETDDSIGVRDFGPETVDVRRFGDRCSRAHRADRRHVADWQVAVLTPAEVQSISGGSTRATKPKRR